MCKCKLLLSVSDNIAFQTHKGQDTIFTDHVSIQSRGNLPNDGLEAGLLGGSHDRYACMCMYVCMYDCHTVTLQ